MSFRQFFSEIWSRSWEDAKKAAHTTVFYIYLILGLVAVASWVGFSVHVEEPRLIWILVPVIALALIFGVIRYAYAIYREEYDRRVALENPPTLDVDRKRLFGAYFKLLTHEQKVALRQLYLVHQMHGDHVRSLFPHVDFVKLNELVPCLDWKAPDYWSIQPDWRDVLGSLLIPVLVPPGPQTEARETIPFLVRLCRYVNVPVRVIEAGWDAARTSKSWKSCHPKFPAKEIKPPHTPNPSEPLPPGPPGQAS